MTGRTTDDDDGDDGTDDETDGQNYGDNGTDMTVRTDNIYSSKVSNATLRPGF